MKIYFKHAKLMIVFAVLIVVSSTTFAALRTTTLTKQVDSYSNTSEISEKQLDDTETNALPIRTVTGGIRGQNGCNNIDVAKAETCCEQQENCLFVSQEFSTTCAIRCTCLKIDGEGCR